MWTLLLLEVKRECLGLSSVLAFLCFCPLFLISLTSNKFDFTRGPKKRTRVKKRPSEGLLGLHVGRRKGGPWQELLELQQLEERMCGSPVPHGTRAGPRSGAGCVLGQTRVCVTSICLRTCFFLLVLNGIHHYKKMFSWGLNQLVREQLVSRAKRDHVLPGQLLPVTRPQKGFAGLEWGRYKGEGGCVLAGSNPFRQRGASILLVEWWKGKSSLDEPGLSELLFVVVLKLKRTCNKTQEVQATHRKFARSLK